MTDLKTENWTDDDGLLVTLHDPWYYFPSTNPLTIPKIDLYVLTLTYSKWYNWLTSREIDKLLFGFKMIYLEVTKVTRLNTHDNPCNDSTDYNFSSCIESYLSKVRNLTSTFLC